MKNKQEIRQRRQGRVRAKISGTAARPRLSVFRSLSHIQAQLIDDTIGKTLLSVSDTGLAGTKTAKAGEVGKKLAAAALVKGVKGVVFDRSSHKYHGRIKALAEAARAGGLEF
ncbi:50S ribosomal protein L18 [Candidatus Falkowbacteria bacterium]|nr:50S ribosomal protein L18 [Candidatus Falkowbacteria bacterium]